MLRNDCHENIRADQPLDISSIEPLVLIVCDSLFAGLTRSFDQIRYLFYSQVSDVRALLLLLWETASRGLGPTEEWIVTPVSFSACACRSLIWGNLGTGNPFPLELDPLLWLGVQLPRLLDPLEDV